MFGRRKCSPREQVLAGQLVGSSLICQRFWQLTFRLRCSKNKNPDLNYKDKRWKEYEYIDVETAALQVCHAKSQWSKSAQILGKIVVRFSRKKGLYTFLDWWYWCIGVCRSGSSTNQRVHSLISLALAPCLHGCINNSHYLDDCPVAGRGGVSLNDISWLVIWITLTISLRCNVLLGSGVHRLSEGQGRKEGHFSASFGSQEGTLMRVLAPKRAVYHVLTSQGGSLVCFANKEGSLTHFFGSKEGTLVHALAPRRAL